MAGRMPGFRSRRTPVVPWLWCLEVTNAILVKERRKVVSPAEGAQLLGLFDELGVSYCQILC